MYIYLEQNMESPSFFNIQSGRRLNLWDREEVQALRRLPTIHLRKCLFRDGCLDFLYVLFFTPPPSVIAGD